MKENEISRQEFDDLKSDVKDLHRVFDQITNIVVSVEKLATEIKYMREEQNKMEARQNKAEKAIAEIKEKPAKRLPLGFEYFNTDLNKVIYFKGNDTWVDSTGTVV